MKKILLIISIALASTVNAQVSIGGTSVSSPSVSLEFGTGNRGIILPYVTSAAAVQTAGVVDGTLIYDIADYRIKLRANGSWKDLSNDDNGTASTTIQDSKIEKTNAKAAIGTNGATDTTPGILVLTDNNKAMILPKVASPHLNIISPSAGMMVFDTAAKQLAVYNGSVWSFWKP